MNRSNFMKIYKSLLILTLITSVCSAKAADTDKTLVSWVTLNNKAIKGGSVLTVEHELQFDGIVYAELGEARWMAGSDRWGRTNKEQNEYAREDADANTLIQMAIVYKDDSVTIYRNGEIYASHKAKNIDLLNKDGNIVTFGIRHTQGNGRVDAKIEDARIYKQALSQKELKQLVPNKESSIKAFAWWDFEGDKMIDFMGRYEHSVLASGATLKDGKLDLGRKGLVIAGAEEVVARKSSGIVHDKQNLFETPVMPENPPKTWLTYHLAHPGPGKASPGDPNPAFFWKGRYHLHYIYKNHTGFVFAHVSSDDMVHWEWHSTVLGPKTMGHGMFSGTGFITMDGRAAMTYHGQGSKRNWISYALDDNLDKWSKPHEMTPRDKDGKLMTDTPYFDPDIWINNGIYYGLNGVSSKKPTVMMKSNNLKDWDYIGDLLHPDFDEGKLRVGRDEDLSCANMFRLGDKWVLLCISHKLGCRYFIGDFKDEQFLPEQHGMMNWASWNFFAPESLLTPDGRRVMWAWCSPRGASRSLGKKLQTGIQSLPRELSLSEEGSLLIKPLRELKKLRTDEKRKENLTVKSDTTQLLKGMAGDTMELEIVLKAPAAREFGIKVLCDKDGNNGFTIASGKGSKTLNVGYINPPFELKQGEDLTLRIFIDKHMIEVFANDRQAAVAWHDYKPNDLQVSLFSKGGDLKVKRVSAWQMKSIYPKAEVGQK